VVEDLASGLVMDDLLQRPGSSGNILRQRLARVVVACLQRRRDFRERLRDQTEVHEQADSALPQKLCQPRRVADRKNEVELAGAVETAFKYEGMEVWIMAKRVAEGRVGEDCCAEMGSGCRDKKREDSRGERRPARAGRISGIIVPNSAGADVYRLLHSEIGSIPTFDKGNCQFIASDGK
jgi:hypothetical protein